MKPEKTIFVPGEIALFKHFYYKDNLVKIIFKNDDLSYRCESFDRHFVLADGTVLSQPEMNIGVVLLTKYIPINCPEYLKQSS